jgi:hypothetical protein
MGLRMTESLGLGLVESSTYDSLGRKPDIGKRSHREVQWLGEASGEACPPQVKAGVVERQH